MMKTKRTTRPAWTKYNCNTQTWDFDEEKARERWEDAYSDVDGIIRWKSNDSVPPTDCLEDFCQVGLLDETTVKRSAEVSLQEQRKSMAEYRERMKDYVPSAEEQFEMRAAFGPGAEVVNVLTGKKFRT